MKSKCQKHNFTEYGKCLHVEETKYISFPKNKFWDYMVCVGCASFSSPLILYFHRLRLPTHVGVLLHNPSSGPQGVFFKLYNHLYYNIPNKILFTILRLHVILWNHPQKQRRQLVQLGYFSDIMDVLWRLGFKTYQMTFKHYLRS